MYKLTYKTAFEISDYETVTKQFEETYNSYEDAETAAYEAFYGDFGPIHIYDIKIDGENIFSKKHIVDDDLPF